MCRMKIRKLKFLLFLISVFHVISLHAQNAEELKEIIEEGKLLYRSEMMKQFPSKALSIGGYVSYAEHDKEKCVFFSTGEPASIIATITFDSTFNIYSAPTDTSNRPFTTLENDLYTIRKMALNEINQSDFFTTYDDIDLNLIPLIDDKQKRVFIMSGPEEKNIVLFGGDYVLTFDKDNRLIEKKKIHHELTRIKNDAVKESSRHFHSAETGNNVTSTDICTLLLYEKYSSWKTHTILSDKERYTWDCINHKLTVIKR
jgi:hypothetical protein